MRVIEVDKAKVLFKLLQFDMLESQKEQMNKDIDYLLRLHSFEINCKGCKNEKKR